MRSTKEKVLLSGMVVAVALAILSFLSALRRSGRGREGPALSLDRGRREIRLSAVAHPGHFSRFLVQPGHHALVWEKGRARFGALFVTRASDQDVRAALQTLGAVAGENLTAASWTERKNISCRDSDLRVAGAPIDVFIEWPGSNGAVPLSDLIQEQGRAANFDFRFGGNERFRDHFKSGCIVCDYSCPGGAIGNHNRTIRDEVKLGEIFTVDPKRVPGDGTEVIAILRLRTGSKSSQ